MNKLLLILTLLIYSSPSFGEWKKLYTINDATLYIETDTVEKNKSKVYFNILTSYLEPKTSFGTLSIVNRAVINCKTNQYKSLWLYSYKRVMGKGDPFIDYDPKFKWIKIIDEPDRNTMMMRVKKLYC